MYVKNKELVYRLADKAKIWRLVERSHKGKNLNKQPIQNSNEYNDETLGNIRNETRADPVQS